MKTLKILETASYAPLKVVKNDDLQKFVDTNDEWIVSRTGISTRHFAENETNVDMATKVGLKLLEKSGISREEISAVIVATFTPDNFTPSVACIVHKNLDLQENVLTFDFNTACSGFIYGLHIAKGLLLQNPCKKVMLIGSEKISKHLNFSDRNTCVLFGDGAGGAILELSEIDGEDFSIFGCKGDDKTIVCGANDGEKIFMAGQEVFTFAVTVICQSIDELLSKSGLNIDEIDHIVCHQANLRIINRVQKKTKIEQQKFFVNLDKYGNTSSASIPIALNEMNEQGLLKRGEKVICVGFGAGLTWGATLLTW
ncbi:MAG: beta-ketoacyl-ACP synthase III [Clostridia bacterium]